MDNRTERELNKAAIGDFIGRKEYTQEELDNIDKYLSLSSNVNDRAAAHLQTANMHSPIFNRSSEPSPVYSRSLEPSEAVLRGREIYKANNPSAFVKTMDSVKGFFADIFDKKAQNEQEGLPSKGGSTASFEQFEVPNQDQDVKKVNKFDNDGLQR